ncbi:hypothetical protein Tco_0668793 [Tanacetum coccineum]
MKNDDSIFLFKFANSMGMEQVLDQGPWLIRNTPLILNKWTPSLPLKKDVVTKFPIWVKLLKVPLVAYSEDGLSLIANEIDLKKEVIMVVPNDDETDYIREVISVEYEWKPPRTFYFKLFDVLNTMDVEDESGTPSSRGNQEKEREERIKELDEFDERLLMNIFFLKVDKLTSAEG